MLHIQPIGTQNLAHCIGNLYSFLSLKFQTYLAKSDNTEYLLKKNTTEKYKGMYVQTDK